MEFALGKRRRRGMRKSRSVRPKTKPLSLKESESSSASPPPPASIIIAQSVEDYSDLIHRFSPAQFGILLKSTNLDLSKYAVEILSVVLPQARHADELRRLAALDIVRCLSQKSSNRDAVETMFHAIKSVIGGSEGRLRFPYQRVGMINAVKELSNSPEGKYVTSLSPTICTFLLSCYKEDGNEEVKLASLYALGFWAARSADAVQLDLISLVASGLKEKEALRRGHLRCLRVMSKKADTIVKRREKVSKLPVVDCMACVDLVEVLLVDHSLRVLEAVPAKSISQRKCTGSKTPFVPSVEVLVKALNTISSTVLSFAPNSCIRIIFCAHHPCLVGSAKQHSVWMGSGSKLMLEFVNDAPSLFLDGIDLKDIVSIIVCYACLIDTESGGFLEIAEISPRGIPKKINERSHSCTILGKYSQYFTKPFSLSFLIVQNDFLPQWFDEPKLRQQWAASKSLVGLTSVMIMCQDPVKKLVVQIFMFEDCSARDKAHKEYDSKDVILHPILSKEAYTNVFKSSKEYNTAKPLCSLQVVRKDALLKLGRLMEEMKVLNVKTKKELEGPHREGRKGS
ncbi:eIF-2-alpha kinase activator GCN1 [Orobanche hederae]